MANMVYITLDELKEILPDILDNWIDDDDESWEWIFQEIEQKCHIGKKKKDKKNVEDEINVLKSKIDSHLKDVSSVVTVHRNDINKLEIRVDELSNKVNSLNDRHTVLTSRINRMEQDITAAKSMAQTAKQRTEVDYTKCADSNGYITEAQVAQNIYNRMANRGATRDELNSFREVVKKYDATSYSWNNFGTDKWEAKNND